MKSHARRGTQAMVAVLLAASAGVAAAQADAWSDQFDRPGLWGRVFALKEYGGDLIAGGLTLQGDGQQLGNVARWNGQIWQPLGAGVNGFIVEDFAIYQGDLVAAGNFGEAGGLQVGSIARWNGTQWQPLGGGIGLSYAQLGTVFALEVYQNELYAAGNFDLAGGLTVANIARWNGSQWSAVSSGFDGDVYALKTGADGKLYAGGAFGHAGGVSVNNIAVWDGTSWSALGPGLSVAFNSPVYALEWHASKLWAGGYFDVPGGQLFEKLASWDGSTWQGEGSFPDTVISTDIVALLSDGTDLYVGGSFGSVNGIGTGRIARLSGSQWTAFGGVRGYANTNVVIALARHGNLIVAGGNFTIAGTSLAPSASVVSNSIAGFDGTSWQQIGKGLGFNAGVSSGMRWNGGIVAVGSFKEAGRAVAPSVAFFDGVDWSRMGEFDGPAYDLCVFQNELVIAGNFSQVDGQSIVGVAAFDGTAWHGFGSGFGGGYGGQTVAVYQNQLYAGTVGGVKRWNGTTWESFAPQIFGSIGDLHVHENVLYIAGIFTLMGGHIASWNGTTQQIVGGGMNDGVGTLVSFGGDLIAGGSFTQAGSVSANRLARWNGSAWSAFPGITGLEVWKLTVFNGELYASGNTLQAPPSISYIGRWDGSQWQALGGGLNAPASALIPDEAAGRLYAGGMFTRAESWPAWAFASWQISGPRATVFCTGGGSASPCPCGNAGAVQNGCASSSYAFGAHLAASGAAGASATTDTLVLKAVDVSGPGLFFQGTSALAGSFSFGDGLLCTGGAMTRLGVVFPVGGLAAYPGGTSPIPIHVAGATTAGDVRYYQFWYRDAGETSPGLSFCTPSTFNLTNGLGITWTQ